MIIRRILAGLLFLVSGCADLPKWLPLPMQANPNQSDAGPGVFSFDWELSGDESVAPLQVFDNGQFTWLQFAPDQAVPAILHVAAAGHTPVAFSRQGPYVVLPGVWPELLFRGGHLAAHARRVAAPRDQSSEVGTPLAVDEFTERGNEAVPAIALPISEVLLAQGNESSVPVMSVALSGRSADEATPHYAEPAPAPSTPAIVFEVGPGDTNLRQALARWATTAGWTFNADHWAVSVDIPIAAAARFSSDFIPSVQSLVAATELSEHPLQPCFYANQVLRVVSYAQPCDRTATPATATEVSS